MNRNRMDRRAFCLGAAAFLAAGGAGPASGKVALGPNADLGGARPFPEKDPWNLDVSRLPVDPRSAMLIKSIGLDKPLHPSFGTTYKGVPNGIPYLVVPASQARVPVRFDFPEESDPGPYPIPPDAPIEGGPDAEAGSDRHILIVDRDEWKLYELFNASRDASGWRAGSGAIFDLRNNNTRPAGWTSADAAGLPIFPGLVRYDEVAGLGAIRHALRFTCAKIRRAYVAPARHWSTILNDPKLPPMGLRVRLKDSFRTGGFPPQARVVLDALKTYGMILADVGGDWFITGSPDPRWDDDALATLHRVKGRDLEVLKMGEVTAG